MLNMHKTILAAATLVLGATAAHGSPPNGYWQFGTVTVLNQVSGPVECGYSNTYDLGIGTAVSQFAGDGKNAGKIILPDIDIYTFDSQGIETSDVTYSGSVIMTFTSSQGGTAKWVSQYHGETGLNTVNPQPVQGNATADFYTFQSEVSNQVAHLNFYLNNFSYVGGCTVFIGGRYYPL